MTVKEAPEIELPPEKRQKLDSKTYKEVKVDNSDPFYPFKLVPSPQEARSLETRTFPLLQKEFPDNKWTFG